MFNKFKVLGPWKIEDRVLKRPVKCLKCGRKAKEGIFPDWYRPYTKESTFTIGIDCDNCGFLRGGTLSFAEVNAIDPNWTVE